MILLTNYNFRYWKLVALEYEWCGHRKSPSRWGVPRCSQVTRSYLSSWQDAIQTGQAKYITCVTLLESYIDCLRNAEHFRVPLRLVRTFSSRSLFKTAFALGRTERFWRFLSETYALELSHWNEILQNLVAANSFAQAFFVQQQTHARLEAQSAVSTSVCARHGSVSRVNAISRLLIIPRNALRQQRQTL